MSSENVSPGLRKRISTRAYLLGLRIYDTLMLENGVPPATGSVTRRLSRYLPNLPPEKWDVVTAIGKGAVDIFGLGEGNNPAGSTFEELSIAGHDATTRILGRSWQNGSEKGLNGKGTVASENRKEKAPFMPERLKYSDNDWKVVRYLGFDTEREFIEKTEERLMNIAIRAMENDGHDYDIHAAKQRLRESINFAKAAYSTRANRKSGESYYCHVLRTLHYTIDYLRISNSLSGDPLELVDIFQTSLLHDFKEDVDDKKVLDWSDPKDLLMKGAVGKTYYLRKNRDQQYEQTSLVVSNRANIAIDALTSPEMETDAPKFMKAVNDSGWPITAAVKMCDRIDNVLTQRGASKDLGSYLYKLYEAELGTAYLSQGMSLAYDDNRLQHNFPIGLVLSVGLMNEATNALREQLLEVLKSDYGYDLRQLDAGRPRSSAQQFLDYDANEALKIRNMLKAHTAPPELVGMK